MMSPPLLLGWTLRGQVLQVIVCLKMEPFFEPQLTRALDTSPVSGGGLGSLAQSAPSAGCWCGASPGQVSPSLLML